MNLRSSFSAIILVGLLVVAEAVPHVFAEENTKVQVAMKQCEKGAAIGCSSLGAMYATGKGVKQDDFEAVKWYRTACERGEASGCGSLGVM